MAKAQKIKFISRVAHESGKPFDKSILDDDEKFEKFQTENPGTFKDPSVQQAQKDYLKEEVSNKRYDYIEQVNQGTASFTVKLEKTATDQEIEKTIKDVEFSKKPGVEQAQAAYEKAKAALEAFTTPSKAAATMGAAVTPLSATEAREEFVRQVFAKLLAGGAAVGATFSDELLDKPAEFAAFKAANPTIFDAPEVKAAEEKYVEAQKLDVKAQKAVLEHNVDDKFGALFNAIRTKDSSFTLDNLKDDAKYEAYKAVHTSDVFADPTVEAAKEAYEKAQAELKAFNEKLNADAIDVTVTKAAAPKAGDTAEKKEEQQAGAKTKNPNIDEDDKKREFVSLFGNKNIFEAFLNNFVYNPAAAFPNYVFFGQFAIIGTAMMNSRYQASVARTSERKIEAELKKIEKSGKVVESQTIRGELKSIKDLDKKISEKTKEIKAAKGDIDSNAEINHLQELKNESKVRIKELVAQVAPASNTILKEMERAEKAREESAKLGEGLGGATLQALGNVVKVVAVGTVVLAPAVLAMGGPNLAFEGGAGIVQAKLCEVNEKKDRKDQNWALQEVSESRKDIGTPKNATDPNAPAAGMTATAVHNNSMALNIVNNAAPAAGATIGTSSGPLAANGTGMIRSSLVRRLSSVSSALESGNGAAILPLRSSSSSVGPGSLMTPAATGTMSRGGFFDKLATVAKDTFRDFYTGARKAGMI